MKPKIYNEFKVDIVGGKPDLSTKRLTKRGTVSIHEHEAEINNRQVVRTKLYYIEAEIQPEKQTVNAEIDPEFEALKKEADELGIRYNKNISKEKLQVKIDTLKK